MAWRGLLVGVADYIAQAAWDGFFKNGVLAGVDPNVGKFKNHGGGLLDCRLCGRRAVTVCLKNCVQFILVQINLYNNYRPPAPL
jgi:hypothetical protein